MSNYAESTILVTGATGLLGSNLVHALMKKGSMRVIAMGRSYAKLVDCFQQYEGKNNFLMVAHDISRPLAIPEVINYIFHAAGPIGGNTIQNQPLHVIAPNLLGLYNCLNFLKQQRDRVGLLGRMVVFSSATVYGSLNKGHWCVTEEETQSADVLHSKICAYSETKRMAEVLALSYAHQYDLDVVIGRFSYVYGYSFFEPKTALYGIVDQAIDGKDITILNPDQKKLDYIFVEDAVEGISVVGEKGTSGQIYNISSNGDLENYLSFDQMAQCILNVTNGLNLYSRLAKLRLPSQGVLRNNGLRLKNDRLKELNWSVTTAPEEGVLKIIRYKLCKLGRENEEI